MNRPPYISPTQYNIFYSDREAYYLKYLADVRPPRLAQTPPMSIGASFDAYIKSYLSEKLFGEVREGFDLKTIFEKQVESQNRDWAWENGNYAFEAYKGSGALSALLLEMDSAINEPVFEFRVHGKVKHESAPEGIPLLGLPDLYFLTKERIWVILDWKINGYCGKHPVSPKKGFLRLWDCWDYSVLGPSRGAGEPHKNALLEEFGGLTINGALNLEDLNKEWANQVTIYAWVIGVKIGVDFISAIDQIVAKPTEGEFPLLRVAQHRVKVSEAYQKLLFMNIVRMWEMIQSGWVFDEVSRDESDKKCILLDEYHKAFIENPSTDKEQWFNEIMGR